MDDEPNLTDKVDIISTEDERLKVIGEILSVDSSRKILQLLFNKSFTAGQIAQQTDMSLPLVIHHLKKMQSVGVVKITNVGKNTKSHDMKFYTIDKVALVILPSEMKSPAKKSKSLFNSFTRIHRVATLGGVSIAAWFSTKLLQKSSTIDPQMAMRSIPEQTESEEITGSIIADESIEMKSIPQDADESSLAGSAPATTGEPLTDIIWPAITVGVIIVVWAIIEVVIKRRC